MDLVCEKSILRGDVEIPGSKSHTIRAVTIAALAAGESVISRPLDSEDARAAVRAYSDLGAKIELGPDRWRITGTGGALQPPENVIDVANSGTTLRIAMGSCALLRKGMAVLTGDEQVRRRPGGPLAQALIDLGAHVASTRQNGMPPFVIQGRLRGGKTTVEGVSSQYVTSLLLSAPLADGDSVIRVTNLNEQPYVEMTLDWLERQGVQVQYENLAEFRVPGGQSFRAVGRRIPADFSSATFFLAAGALGENEVFARGLDVNDTQGDRAVVDYLLQMGASVVIEEEGIRVKGHGLKGGEFDLNATPDALPAMAVLGCFAKGTTRLVNVPQARLKETDRLAVMRVELERMGGRVTELEDGLVVEESGLHGADVDGHGDHRVVMALAIAGAMLDGETRIRGYEAAAVTYPGFADALARIGGNVRLAE
ncbi:MAG TPA: 3-phosphoshikimate 1-carboxyvinyltransferase [Candidatus Hydrogenedentes bacterium]|nr:3-phosphoshikimate 1-carboxyvinyltransferase [Candidatus Hydrogenedentota bacterium]